MTTQNMLNLGLNGASGTGMFAGTTSPIFTTPTLGVASATTVAFSNNGGILDNNGNKLLIFTTVASAVNYLIVANTTTGSTPNISAEGSDSTVALGLNGKGDGVNIADSTATISGLLRLYNAAGTHYTTLSIATAAAANYNIVLPSADGSNGSLVTTNGSGVWAFTTATYPSTAGTSGNVLTSDGTNWVSQAPSGSVPSGTLFNFQTTNTTSVSSVSSGTMGDVTGLSVAITPTSSSNKVLVRAVIQASSASGVACYQLVRTSTAIGVGAAAGSRTVCGGVQWGTGQANVMGTVVLEFLDSPSTTSATTYKVQMSSLGGGGTAYCNQSYTDTNAAAYPRTSSTISVCEVHA